MKFHEKNSEMKKFVMKYDIFPFQWENKELFEQKELKKKKKKCKTKKKKMKGLSPTIITNKQYNHYTIKLPQSK